MKSISQVQLDQETNQEIKIIGPPGTSKTKKLISMLEEVVKDRIYPLTRIT